MESISLKHGTDKSTILHGITNGLQFILYITIIQMVLIVIQSIPMILQNYSTLEIQTALREQRLFRLKKINLYQFILLKTETALDHIFIL